LEERLPPDEGADEDGDTIDGLFRFFSSLPFGLALVFFSFFLSRPGLDRYPPAFFLSFGNKPVDLLVLSSLSPPPIRPAALRLLLCSIPLLLLVIIPDFVLLETNMTRLF
jgi:hypothetical protein